MREGASPGAPGEEQTKEEVIQTPTGEVKSTVGGAAADTQTTKTSTEQIGPGSEFHTDSERQAESEDVPEQPEEGPEANEEEDEDIDTSWRLSTRLGKALGGLKARLRRKKGEEAEPGDESPEDIVDEEVGSEGEEAPEGEPGEEGEEQPSKFDAFRDRMKASFKHSADRLKRRFTGEVLEEEQEDYEYTKTDVAGAVATGMLSVAMTYTGTKFFVDMPQYVSQKIFTSRERSQLLDYLKTIDEEAKESFAPDVVEKKKELIKARIEKSTFLTEAKKAELIQKLQDTAEQYHTEMGEHEEARNEQFAKELQEAIDSRIKGTQVLKEGVNTALVASGVATFRTIGYTTFALAERYKKVQAERAEGKREGSLLHEMFVGGAKETWHNLKGGDAEDWKGKGMNRLKAATTLMRGAAIGSLAAGEILGDGKLMDVIEKSIGVFEEKGVAGGAMQHLGEHAAIFTGEGFDPNSEANRLARAATAETAAVGAVAAAGEMGDATEGAELGEAGAAGEAAPEGEKLLTKETAEAPEAVEEAASFDEETVKEAMVGEESGRNSIIGLLKDQLKSDPEKFGYEGNPDGVNAWASRTAISAARENGLLTTGGDTRLATEAVDRMAVVATAEGEGVGVAFFDTEHDAVVTADQARELGLTYDHSGGGGGYGRELPPLETSGAAGIDRLDLGDQGIDFEYNEAGDTVTGMNFEGLDALSPADSETVEAMMGGTDSVNESLLEQAGGRKEDIENLSQRLLAWARTLEKMDKRGLGESAEAMSIRELVQADLNFVDSYSQSYGAIDADSDLVRDLREQAERFDPTVLENPDADGVAPLESLRVPGVGKLEFEGGLVTLNEDQLLSQLKPSVLRAAEKLLTEGWEEHVDAGFLENATVYKESAAKVYVMEKALRALESQGMGESGEALHLKQAIGRELDLHGDLFDQSNETVKSAVADAGTVLAPETPVDTGGEEPPGEGTKVGVTEASFVLGGGEPDPGEVDPGLTDEGGDERIKKFVGEDDRIRFRYNREGEVKGAAFPLFRTITKREMTEAIERWGLSPGEVYTAYQENGHYNDFNTQAREMMRYMAIADQKEAVLNEMAAQGLSDTPEYDHLNRQILSARGNAARMIHRVLPGHEIPTRSGDVLARDFDPKNF